MIELLIYFLAGFAVAGGIAVYNIRRGFACSTSKAIKIVATGGGGGGGPLEPH